MDVRIRKKVALHLRDVIDYYKSRKGGRRRIDSFKESVDVSIRGLEDYIENKYRWITAASNSINNIKSSRTTSKIGK